MAPCRALRADLQLPSALQLRVAQGVQEFIPLTLSPLHQAGINRGEVKGWRRQFQLQGGFIGFYLLNILNTLHEINVW